MVLFFQTSLPKLCMHLCSNSPVPNGHVKFEKPYHTVHTFPSYTLLQTAASVHFLVSEWTVFSVRRLKQFIAKPILTAPRKVPRLYRTCIYVGQTLGLFRVTPDIVTNKISFITPMWVSNFPLAFNAVCSPPFRKYHKGSRKYKLREHAGGIFTCRSQLHHPSDNNFVYSSLPVGKS